MARSGVSQRIALLQADDVYVKKEWSRSLEAGYGRLGIGYGRAVERKYGSGLSREALGKSVRKPEEAEEKILSSRKALLDSLGRLYKESINCDLVILAGKGSDWTEIKAHKIVVAARCKSLREEIEAEQKKNGSREIRWTWQDVSSRIARSAVEFFYTGKLSISDDMVFEIWDFALRLGVDSICRLAQTHVSSNIRASNCLFYLKKSQELPHVDFDKEVLKYIRINTHKVVETGQFCKLPSRLIRRILCEDQLSCSEEQLWRALVRVGMEKNQLYNSSLSDLSNSERRCVYQTIAPFLKPGLLRIYDLNPVIFAREVEASGLLPTEEVLEKYRYDVVLSYAGISELYRNRASIMERIRGRIVVVESDHPHVSGSLAQLSKHMVELPSWCRETTIIFDLRSTLGRYADLCIFLDAAEEHKIFSFYYEQRDRQNNRGRRKEELKIVIPQRRFWYTFYSPANFAPDWGYRFECTVTKSDFDVAEDAIDRIAQSTYPEETPETNM